MTQFAFANKRLKQRSLRLKILVLSPHRDDAAFSLSLSIAQWLAAGHHVLLLNCFTRSLYAPLSDAEHTHSNDRLGYVSALRRREDEHFIRKLRGATRNNIELIDLNIKDAPLRLRCSSDVVCDLEVDPADRSIPKIQKSLAGQIAAGKVEALVLPLALGHHVDHRTARDAALPLSISVPCAFYEDLPYATRPGVTVDLEAFRRDASTRLHQSLHPALCQAPAAVQTKRKLALGYASQIDDAAADLISSFADRYDGGERLWVNDAWAAISGAARLSKPQLVEQPLPA